MPTFLSWLSIWTNDLDACDILGIVCNRRIPAIKTRDSKGFPFSFVCFVMDKFLALEKLSPIWESSLGVESGQSLGVESVGRVPGLESGGRVSWNTDFGAGSALTDPYSNIIEDPLTQALLREQSIVTVINLLHWIITDYY